MGNILSKIKAYIHTKVKNSTLAVKRKVDNTRNAIYTGVTNTKQLIVGKIVNTKDAICQRVSGVKNGIQNRINAAADAVFNSVNTLHNGIRTKITDTATSLCNFKNGVISKCVQTKDGVIRKYTNAQNAVVTKYTNTKNGVISRYRNTRDGIVKTYTDSRDYVYVKYRQAHEVKLSRYEKFKYSILFLFFLSLFVLTVLTAWDLYYENYERIHNRNKSIWLLICYLCDNLWNLTQQGLLYLYQATVIFFQYLWYTSVVIVYYSWQAAKLVSLYTWEGIKIGAGHILEGSKISWHYISIGLVLTGHYIWHGISICSEYLVIGATVTCEYIILGSKWGLHYSLEGSKLAIQYAAEGTKYAILHGSVAFKDGSIKFIQWLFYFMTNFRAASKEAAAFLYEFGIYLGDRLLYWIYHGSIMLVSGTWFIAGKSWDGTVVFCQTAVSAYCILTDLLHSGVSKFIFVTDTSAFAVYSAIIYIVMALHDSTIWFFQMSNHCINVLVAFIWTWSNYIIITSLDGIYIGIREYGFIWACYGGKQILHWCTIFGAILWKFLTDVFIYASNCVYTGCMHIYSVFYIIFSFIYQLFSALSTMMKTSAQGLRYCVTSVFGIIIWCLEETIFAYAFMLNKYNMYREILFASFIVLLCLYCTGLMRDRKRSLEERNGEISDSSSEDDEDDVDDALPRLIPRKKDLELPSFPDTGKNQFPNYDDGASEEDSQHTDATKQSLEDLLPITDDEDEFELEQNVPDFMDLSGSEPEPELPEIDSTDQDTGSHDLSFGSHQSQESGQEVPDIDFLHDAEEKYNEELITDGSYEKSTEDILRKDCSDLDMVPGTEAQGNNTLEHADDFDLSNNRQDLTGHEADLEDEEELSTDALTERLDLIKQRRS